VEEKLPNGFGNTPCSNTKEIGSHLYKWDNTPRVGNPTYLVPSSPWVGQIHWGRWDAPNANEIICQVLKRGSKEQHRVRGLRFPDKNWAVCELVGCGGHCEGSVLRSHGYIRDQVQSSIPFGILYRLSLFCFHGLIQSRILSDSDCINGFAGLSWPGVFSKCFPKLILSLVFMYTYNPIP